MSIHLCWRAISTTLAKCAYLFLDATDHFTEGKFTIIGKPVDFMNLIISNLNRLYPGAGWALGTVDDSDYTSVDFDSQNCLQVWERWRRPF